MKRDGLDEFIHHAVPPVQISAQRVEHVVDAVMQCLDARVAHPVGFSPMVLLSRFAMPVAFGGILGVLAGDLSPTAPAAWGVSSLVSSVYYLSGNF